MERRSFFDRYAAGWDANERADMPELVQRVVRLTELHPGDAVLDVGSGTGVIIPPLLEAVGAGGLVVAIELSLGMLAVARAKRFPANVHLLRTDAGTPPFRPSTFDCVMCNAVFPHFEDKDLTLSALVRLLRPGGSLVIAHPIGRDAVNKVHSGAEEVADDQVPDAAHMERYLARAGLGGISVIDEPEFYWAVGRLGEA